MNEALWAICGVAVSLKMMFIQAYHSTDFEVHRNWLALTFSLPLKEWYTNTTSPWTLDYPPFFAMFEWVLAQIAAFVDPQMLDINNHNYASKATIYFQRISVILTDVILVAGTVRCLALLGFRRYYINIVLMLVVTNVGLIFVDNIHFQYNGMLLGILLLSVSYMFEDRYLASIFAFAVLLNFKHIFLYVAPVYAVFCLKFYCWNEHQFIISNFLKLIVVGLTPFIAAFGPFWDQLPIIFRRLFPFGRGLTHAYWAPNFWALYNTVDRGLSYFMQKTNAGVASTTTGLVKQTSHVVLPNVTPLATFILTVGAMMPVLWMLLRTPKSLKNVMFLRALILSSLAAFIFGWHVHEKAILMSLIPFSLLYLYKSGDGQYCFLLSVVGYFSLGPLLYKPELLVLRYSLQMTFIGLMMSLHLGMQRMVPRLQLKEWLYCIGLVTIPVYEHVIAPLMQLDKKLPFLPLLLTSFYCCFGVMYVFVKYFYYSLTEIGKEKRS